MSGLNAGGGTRRWPERRLALRWIAAAAAAASVLTAPAAMAQGVDPIRDAVSQADPRAAFERLVGLLDDAEHRTRQEASIALMSDDRFTMDMIIGTLRGSELTAEQRQRLESAGRRRFERLDHGAMGVGFFGNEATLRTRVVIGSTFQPFHSASVLEPGDLIVEANGVALRGLDAQMRLRGIIISREAGESLKLVVRRGAEKLNLEVRLGRFADLPRASISKEDFDRAWLARLRAEGATGQERVGTAWTMEDWAKAEQQARERRRGREARLRGQGQGGPPQILLAGGRPRGGAADENFPDKIALLGDKNEIPWDELQAAQRAQLAAMEGLEAHLPTLEQELALVRQRAEDYVRSIAELRARIRAGEPIQAGTVEQMTQSAAIYERLLAALRAEMEEAAPAVRTD